MICRIDHARVLGEAARFERAQNFADVVIEERHETHVRGDGAANHGWVERLVETEALPHRVDERVLRPLGYADPGRLILVHQAIPESGVPRFGVSPADYLDIEQMQRSFETLGIYRTRFMELSGSGEPRQIAVTQLTPSVFTTLGVSPSTGRVVNDIYIKGRASTRG